MPKISYILPQPLTHPGIKKKVEGQLKAFKSIGKSSLIYLHNRFDYFHFHVRALRAVSKSDAVYVRYNPKVPLLNIALARRAKHTPIFFEHNIKYDVELKFINRLVERFVHTITEKIIYNSSIIHVGITNDIQNYMVARGAKKERSMAIQNGYLWTPPIKSHVKSSVVNHVKEIAQVHEKLMVFIGNHYPWHGLIEIIDQLKKVNASHTPPIGLLIIGPKEKLPQGLPSYCHVIGKCTPDTITELLPFCHAGFGPMRWDMIDIYSGAPLKTREYLANGLPIITNYHDEAEDIPELAPFVYNVSKNPAAIKECIDSEFDHSTIKALAAKHLSWEETLKPVLNHILDR